MKFLNNKLQSFKNVVTTHQSHKAECKIGNMHKYCPSFELCRFSVLYAFYN